MNILRKFTAITAASFALFAGTAVSFGQTSALYGLTFFDNQLLSINPATGAGTLIASLSQNVNGYGLAFRGSNLYTFDPNVDGVRQINLTNGAVGAPINIGVGNLLGEGDITFRSDGVGFLSSALSPSLVPSRDLFRFDLDVGTSVRVGTTSVVLDGMAFVGNTLYGIGQEAMPSLYIVNQTTAGLTPVGPLGLSLGSPFSGLTVGTNGLLYAALDDRLYTINQATGLASVVSTTVLDIGFDSVSGLAASSGGTLPPRVPDLAHSGVLMVFSLGLLAFLRRRIKAD